MSVAFLLNLTRLSSSLKLVKKEFKNKTIVCLQ